MAVKIGYSTGFFGALPLTNLQRLKKIDSIKHYEAVEFGINSGSRVLVEGFPEELFDLLKHFTYRSLHLPPDLRYPSKELDIILDPIMGFSKRAGIETFVVHPDRIDDFDYINKNFGSALAIENMDNRKEFGKSVYDLEYAFTNCPHAKFVCDINHIFSNDKTMGLASELHKSFGDRLCHYHVSGLGSIIHSFLCKTHEDVMFKGVQNTNKPIILEGGLDYNNGLLEEEYSYVKNLGSYLNK